MRRLTQTSSSIHQRVAESSLFNQGIVLRRHNNDCDFFTTAPPVDDRVGTDCFASITASCTESLVHVCIHLKVIRHRCQSLVGSSNVNQLFGSCALLRKQPHRWHSPSRPGLCTVQEPQESEPRPVLKLSLTLLRLLAVADLTATVLTTVIFLVSSVRRCSPFCALWLQRWPFAVGLLQQDLQRGIQADFHYVDQLISSVRLSSHVRWKDRYAKMPGHAQFLQHR